MLQPVQISPIVYSSHAKEMSTNTSDCVFPQDLIPAGYDLTEEKWQAHVDEIIRIGQQDHTTNEGDEPERELDMSCSTL